MLLRPIVQVALDALPCRVSAGHEAGAAGDEFRAGLGLRDRTVQEFDELVHAFSGVVRRRLGAEVQGGHRSPEMIVHDDGAGHGMSYAVFPHPIADRVTDGFVRSADRLLGPPPLPPPGVLRPWAASPPRG